MKKELVLILLVLMTTFVVADTCDLEVSLINQDPYPAVPGDYVKLVFQVDGVGSSECSDISFKLLEDYPIEFNPGESGLQVFKKVNYLKDYESSILVPYEVRIDEDALDGSNPIEVSVTNQGDSPISKTFNIEVENTIADFEVYVKDYDYSTGELTIEVLNIGDSDIEALTLELDKQDNVQVKGSNRIVVGDLDSNEYTTADFEAIPQDGEIEVKLIYSDSINVRRETTKTVIFDSSYFTDRIADQKSIGVGTYIFWAVIIIIVIYFFYRRHKKKKKKH